MARLSPSCRQRCGPCAVSPAEFKKNFKEQKLAAWQPLYSSGSVAIAFFVIGIFFLVFGAVITVYDAAVIEVVVDYTTCNDCHTAQFNETCQCNVTVDVKKQIPKPVYVQYQLDSFFQNHRRLVKIYNFAKVLKIFCFKIILLCCIDDRYFWSELTEKIFKIAVTVGRRTRIIHPEQKSISCLLNLERTKGFDSLVGAFYSNKSGLL